MALFWVCGKPVKWRRCCDDCHSCSGRNCIQHKRKWICRHCWQQQQQEHQQQQQQQQQWAYQLPRQMLQSAPISEEQGWKGPNEPQKQIELKPSTQALQTLSVDASTRQEVDCEPVGKRPSL